MHRRHDVFTVRKRRFGRWIVILLIMVVASVGVHAAVDNGRIVLLTQRVLVANLPESLEGFTILHISDLNGKRFGPKQKQLENILKGKKYHAVCITGDMVGERGDYYPFYELLSILDPLKPVFFIAGDADPVAVGRLDAGQYTVFSEWVLGAQSRGAQFVDAPLMMEVGKSRVWFSDAAQIPLDLDIAAAAYASSNTALSQYNAGVIDRTVLARESMKEDDLHIALTHAPLKTDTVQRMQSALGVEGYDFFRSVDLILAGGTVGGQWKLPFVGPVWSDGWFPDASQVSGYHYAGSLLQYISGGLGTSGGSPLPSIRLFNTPEMTLITFTSSMDMDVLPR